MLTDPQNVTIRTVATPLPRIALTGDGQTVYADNDGQFAVRISHERAKGKKAGRHTVKLSELKAVVQPDGSSIDRLASAHIVLTVPSEGFTTDEVTELASALTTYCDSTLLERVLGFES